MPGNERNESFGCFVSPTAVRTAKNDDIHRLCFMTTTSGAFRGQPPSSAGQMENLEGVLNMGHKSNKYMSYPLKRVPNLGREMCNYSIDFRKKPFRDGELNTWMCSQLREHGNSGSTFTASLPSSKTQYAADFIGRDSDTMRKARQKSQEPPHRHCDTGRLLVTKSFSQSTHGAPSPEVNSKGQLMRPSHSLVNPKSHWEDAMRTTYSGDFMKRTTKADGRHRRRPSSSCSEPSLLSTTA
uniref:Uncharacterized protein n=1 Tax=Alexandrium andersonii TaxID=327968 RepID=A0A7S2FKN3_9DINO